MAPPPVEQQAARNAGVVALAARQLAALWPRVDWPSVNAIDAVTTLYRAIVTRYGQAAAAVAAEFYDDQRAARQLPSRFRAAPADTVPPEQIAAIVASAFRGTVTVTVLDDPAPTRTRVTQLQAEETTSDLPVDQRVRQRLESSLSRLVLAPARATVADNIAADPAKPRWIRVPTGAKTCEFCMMLASRELGPNFRGYRSEGAALFNDNADRFHKGCNCQAVPVFPGDDPHELSPNMADYQDLYERATESAGTHSDAKKILAHMRQLNRDETRAERPEDRPPAVGSDGGGRVPPKPPVTVGKPAYGDDAEPPAVNAAHVLGGDPDNPTLGGHRHGTGRPGKTEFPSTWTDDQIIAAVHSTLADPEVTIHGGDRSDYLKEVDSVIVRASTYFADGQRVFRTAYPVNGDGVTRNPPAGGAPQLQPLNRDEIERYR